MRDDILLQSLGSTEQGNGILARGQASVPAYRDFLNAAGATASLETAPWTDKSTYIRRYPYREILSNDVENTFTIFASSGSSGSSFYWPQLRAMHAETVPRLAEFLEASFRVSEKRTLAIVGLALGSWIGGEHMSWALKSLALESKFPFSVFSPGNHHDEIIRMIVRANEFVEQFIIFVCPSAIAHLKLRAEAAGTPLPTEKLRFVVLGEAFPETVREAIQQDAGIERSGGAMVSIYGSADTGTLGVESLASIALRKLVSCAPTVAEGLELQPPIPHFFHGIAPDAYLETDHDELVITRWQGVPLFKYNLHDCAQLVSWPAIKSAAIDMARDMTSCADLVAVLKAAPDELPDLIAVAGRADSTLILCGTNITEAMLDEAVKSRELEAFLTGTYRARISYDGARQRLAFDLEFKKDCDISPSTTNEVFGLLIQALGRVQPEFLDDWRSVYHVWDGDTESRILDLTCVSWPNLSDQAGIKQRGIQ